MAIAVCYGIGASAFLALVALMILNRQPRGFGLRIVVVCLLTAAWALAAAVQTWWLPGLAHVLESLSSGAWLFLLATIIADARKGEARSGIWGFLPPAAIVLGVLSALNDLQFLFSTTHAATLAASQILWRVVIATCGILMVENLIRNTPANRKWHVFPLCIAVGGLFAYDLYVFAEAVVLRRLDPSLIAGRGLVLALIVPMLVLTMARNPDWRIDIHVSRRVVFHTATLMAAGIFLVIAAGVAALIGRFPGQWATISKVVFFFGSMIVLLTVLSTENLRSRLKRVISENFFSTRYDYRTEWMRCIATLSSSGDCERLAVRAIRALADVVDSPAGALFMEGAEGSFRLEQTLNMRLDAANEPAGSPFIAGFRDGEAVQEFHCTAEEDSRAPAWAGTSIWLAVPLLKIDHLLGFVVLAPPRAPASLNWESFDLLLTIGQQVAGYLAEERATRSLLESRALIEYSRKFSFVIHDIKNVSGQLAMMIANIPKFGERAEFRADLVRGMESSTRKLSELIDRLRPDAPAAEKPELVDPSQVIVEVVRELDGPDISVRAQIATAKAGVRIAPSGLKAILTHLVRNGIEASASGHTVVVNLRQDTGRVVIEVVDSGCGMSAEFINTSLFAPLRSTKERGHGIGAYQARDLARGAGGDIEVASVVGRGTTMRVLLPDCGAALVAPPLPEAAVS